MQKYEEVMILWRPVQEGGMKQGQIEVQDCPKNLTNTKEQMAMILSTRMDTCYIGHRYYSRCP